MERICCILDENESYAVRMAGCFNSKKILPFSFKAFSELSAFKKCASDNVIEILLVSQELYAKLCQEESESLTRPEFIIVLAENDRLDEEVVSIKKYQAGDDIVREVVSLYGDRRPDALLSKKDGDSKLIMVYSPNGGSGKTMLALSAAYIFGQRAKTLYINLDEFGTLPVNTQGHRGNLSEVLYFYNESKGESVGKMMSAINKSNGFDYIYPTECAADLDLFSYELILGVASRLGKAGEYQNVILDVGNLIKEPWKLLGFADHILVPSPDTQYRRRKQMNYEAYMEGSGYGEVIDRSIAVEVEKEGLIKDGQLNFARLSGSRLGKQVSSIEI